MGYKIHNYLKSSLVMGSRWKMCDCEKGVNSIKKLSAFATPKANVRRMIECSCMMKIDIV